MSEGGKRSQTNLVRQYDGLRTTWVCEHCLVFNSVSNTRCEGCIQPRDPTALPDWKLGDVCGSIMGRGVIKEMRDDDIFVIALQWRLGNKQFVLSYANRLSLFVPKDCVEPPEDTVARYFVPVMLINRGLPDFLELIPMMLAVDSVLETVYLRYQGIGDEGATIIASALVKNMSVCNLMLGNNNITEKGARAVAALLKVNSNVTTVDLSSNNIGVGGVRALAKALERNTTVVDVNLNFNNLRYEGAFVVVRCLLKNRTVRNMMLANNNITPGEARSIVKFLNPHNRAVTLSL